MELESTEDVMAFDASKSDSLNPAKKLKQVRLPFKTINTTSSIVTQANELANGNQKKRRLSDKDNYHQRASKSPRAADFEQENKFSSDPINSKCAKRGHIKFSNEPKITDNEISSSCETEVAILCETGATFCKKLEPRNILEKFIKKEHQQDPEVSTSSEIIDEKQDGCQSEDVDEKTDEDSPETELETTVNSVDLDSSIAENICSATASPSTPISGLKVKIKSALTTEQKLKKRQERERLKQDKLQKMKEVKEEKKIAKDLLKQEREGEKAKRKEEKQKVLDVKMEIKRKKDMERQKKEDEKKQKDEEKLMIEVEEKKKKDKVKMAFASFFVKKDNSAEPNEAATDVEPDSIGQFKPFQITKGMLLAPIVRSQMSDINIFDSVTNSQAATKLYLHELRSKERKPMKGTKTSFAIKCNDKFKDDVEIIDDQEEQEDSDEEEARDERQPAIDEASFKTEKVTAKLIQFHENKRPPFWGTFRKNSNKIKAKKPFNTDADLFDYEVDSDEEWEEEEPGESLHGSDDDKESEDDYDEDGEFMVPHGYLSADEEDEEDAEDDSPETQKEKLKLRAKEFEKDLKKSAKHRVKKPRVVGCMWLKSTDFEKELAANDRLRLMEPYRCVVIDSTSSQIPTSFTRMAESPSDRSPSSSGNWRPMLDELNSKSCSKKLFPEDAMPHLIRLVHANPNGRPNLILEFQHYWRIHRSVENPPPIEISGSAEKKGPNISKRQIEIAIQKIATWGRYTNPEVYNRVCWIVHPDVIEKYKMTDLPVPNRWKYVSQKMISRQNSMADSSSLTPTAPKVNKITNFVRTMSPNSIPIRPSIPANESDAVVILKTIQTTPKSTKTIGPMFKFVMSQQKLTKPPTEDKAPNI